LSAAGRAHPKTGISKSTLSRLETGQRKPSLELLLPLAEAHQVPLDELVGAREVGDPRIRLKPRVRNGRMVFPLTQQSSGPAIWKVIIAPERERELRTHQGYEWLYVLSGQIRLILGEHDITMGPGEVAEFDTRLPHWFGPAGVDLTTPSGAAVVVGRVLADRVSEAAAPAARSASWQDRGMEGVLGIGGYFMRAADPVALGAWYRDCLGLDADENGLWRQGAGPTVFATFEPETDYFGSRAQQTMLNFRVRDLDAMLAQLRAKGADVANETQNMEGVGRFGWVTDPEGNRIELWQPA
jgi:transcriptional regulator with XRE-family HTH domain